MTVYVGIDIAKEFHFASIMNHDGVPSKPFDFESTAHYQDNLTFFHNNLGLKIMLINPLQVSALRKSTIHNMKTDRVDAHLIW